VKIDIEHLKKNFFNQAIGDIYRALDGKSIVGSFILTFCLIDHLNWIEFGDQKFGYNRWIVKRLLPQNIFYTDRDEELFCVRCGLVHTYGPSKTIISQKFMGYHLMECNPALHLQNINNRILNICLYSLLTDTIYAAHVLFEELKIAADNEQLIRLNSQVNSANNNPPAAYKDMHIALGIFDSTNTITANHIKGDYTKYILYPDDVDL
jgi:hypothetical protein